MVPYSVVQCISLYGTLARFLFLEVIAIELPTKGVLEGRQPSQFAP